MGYLYGDLTPFPLEANYIELIRGVTALCHALLQADVAIEGLRRGIEADKQTVAATLSEFKQVARDMAEALQPHVTGHSGPVKNISTRLIQSVRGILEQAQSSMVSTRDANAIEAETKIRMERDRTLPALERFLLVHDLPNTQWSLQWSASPETQRIEARSMAVTPFGLKAAFVLEVPRSSPWSRVVKISEVKSGAALNLPKKARRGITQRKVELDRYHVMRFDRGPKGVQLGLRKTIKPSAPGFGISWQGEELVVTGLDDASFPPEPARLDEFDASVARDLCNNVESQLRPLLQHRLRLENSWLDNTRVDELESPISLARTLIKAVAPYAQEIVKRSPVPGELTLKQVVEDGRREEVFITTAELAAIFASLPADRRACFDDLGLTPAVAEPVTDHVAVVPAPEQPEESDVIEIEPEIEIEEEITKNARLDARAIEANSKEPADKD